MRLQFFPGQADRDMLRTVPVEALDGDHDGTFRAGLVGRIVQTGDQGGIFRRFDQPGPAKHLQPPAVGIIHQDQRDTVVGGQVSSADILPVTAEIGIGDGPRIQHLQEARRAAAELHIGPAGLGNGGLVETVASLDEGGILRPQQVRGVSLGRQEAVIGGGRALARLRGADGGGEGDLGEGAGHGGLPDYCGLRGQAR
jgi:hypothetical protein